jgi:hypothetical protein
LGAAFGFGHGLVSPLGVRCLEWLSAPTLWASQAYVNAVNGLSRAHEVCASNCFPSFTYFIYAKFGTHHIKAALMRCDDESQLATSGWPVIHWVASHHKKAALNHLAPLRATLQALGVSGPRTPKCAGLPVSWANRQPHVRRKDKTQPLLRVYVLISGETMKPQEARDRPLR